MHTWKLPRYITYDLKWPKKPYRVSIIHDGRARYIGNYVTLTEATQARDAYCTENGIQIAEKGIWQKGKNNDTGT